MLSKTAINKNTSFILLALVAGVPAICIRILHLAGIADLSLSPGLTMAIFSLGIVGSAFLLSWAAEVVQKDITQGLALALVALIVVLPEYAVSSYFTWQAGQDPSGEYVHYATANMTGANRLLIGLGWPLVIVVAWYRTKSPLQLQKALSLEILFLTIATVYAFTIPISGSINVWDGLIMVVLFAIYMWRSGKGEVTEPEILGPAEAIDRLGTPARQSVIFFLFLYAATVILISAEPFAESLLSLGDLLGVDEFLLVQWIAPLASESPEILVALIFALKDQAPASMTMLISSKVNQWTLLVGSLPFVYVVSLGQFNWGGLPLDPRQTEEIWLTAAQSLFAVIILLRWRVGWVAAFLLFLPWATQLVFVSTHARYVFTFGYMIMAGAFLLVDPLRRANAINTLRSGWRPNPG
jgi:cation:H+ antiporter